jgi:hypothetical protein
MAVARQYGQPRSIVLGRRLPKPGKRLWLPEDLEWAIAYEQYLATVCGSCGTRREDWERDPDAYVAVTDRCPGCHELAISDEEIPEAERARGARSVLMPGDTFGFRQDIRDAATRLNLRPTARAGG